MGELAGAAIRSFNCVAKKLNVYQKEFSGIPNRTPIAAKEKKFKLAVERGGNAPSSL